MLGNLYLSASTIETAGLTERLDAAAAGGYTGIGLRPTHYKAARAEGRTDADIQAMLADRGLELTEIGFIADWWTAGDAAARAEKFEHSLYHLKETLGGRHVMLISGPLEDPIEVLAERFAAVCDRAAEHGLRVALEALPWTAMHDYRTAWQICELADRPNGGLALDIWHHRRSRGDDDLLRTIPPAAIVTIQLSDGRYELVESDLDDTFKRRLLPGLGEFDPVAFLKLLEGLGVTAPVGVEVLSDELRELSAAEVARLGADATRAALAAARA